MKAFLPIKLSSILNQTKNRFIDYNIKDIVYRENTKCKRGYWKFDWGK